MRLLPWAVYSSILSGFLKQIPLKPQLERTLVRVVCTVVDAFPFNLSVLNDEEEAERKLNEEKKNNAKQLDSEQKLQEDKRIASVSGGVALDAPMPPAAPAAAAEDGKQAPADAAPDAASEAAAAEEESDEEEEEEEETAITSSTAAAADRTTSSIAQARKIRDTIAHRLLPQLYRYLTDASTAERDAQRNAKRAAQKASADVFKQSLAAGTHTQLFILRAGLF